MGLSRDEILKRADDVPTRDVPVPEWGDETTTVRVRCLTMRERMQFAKVSAKASVSDEPGPDPTALVVALAAVDDQGQRLFSVQDSDALADMRGDVIDRLAGEVMELSGLTEKAEPDAEGNSGTTPSGGSPSDSPATSDAPSENSSTD